MSVKTYFKDQFKWDMITLEHSDPTDFYLSCWQKTRSCIPILIFRSLLFFLSVSIAVTSGILYMQDNIFDYWSIYLTHWGLMVNTIATGLACFVCLRCYLKGPLSQDFPLPWYVKMYWAMYNIAIPLAFLITLFYWAVLYPSSIHEELNRSLDIAVHAVNSITMFLLLISSKHPMRILHFYQPLLFGAVFMMFSVIYFFAGGVDSAGNPYIYSVLYWGDPKTAILFVFIAGLLLIFNFTITILISEVRDVLSNLLKPPTLKRSEEVPLKNV